MAAVIAEMAFGGVAADASGATSAGHRASSAPAGTASRAPSGAASCQSARDFGVRWTTSLRGDVDGDGIADRVGSRARWLADGRCRAWLVVATAEDRFSTPIDPLYGTLIKPPGLAGLIALRPGHRLDVAVVVWLGASTGFLDVYGIAGHRLVRLSTSTFEYAGSVVNRAGVDCAAKKGSRLVASFATWDDTDRRYDVERIFYATRAGRLAELPRLTERHVATIGGLARYPELAAQAPFPSCTAVAGSS
jgi:hypothetical protein